MEGKGQGEKWSYGKKLFFAEFQRTFPLVQEK
jgi:hypothetical protein